MKISLNLSKRKRIILFYVVGLILPGIILGFFAFRGLRNDQAIQEKQNQQELKLLSVEVFSQLDKRINEIRESYIENPKKQDSSLLISWNKNVEGQTSILYSQMIFLPDENLDDYPNRPIPIEIENINKIEFVSKDYSSAIQAYQKMIEDSVNSELNLFARLGLARLFKKTDQTKDAIVTYQALIKQHPQELLPGSLPIKAMALLEIIRLSDSSPDSKTHQSASTDFIQFLLNPSIPIGKTAFNYLLEQSQSLNLTWTEDERKELDQKIQLTNYLQTLDQMSFGLFNRSTPVSYIESIDYPAILLQTDGQQESSFAWVLSAQQIIDREINTIFKTLNQDKNYFYEIKINALSDLNSPQKENNIEINFPSNYPPWVLSLGKEDLSGWDQLFKTSKGFLLLVFVFIFLLMIAGLVFMLYTLNQEMKISKMKSQFISNVSHEFKTPLTSIRHMTELMHLKRVDNEDRKEEYLQSMLEQCDHLGHLIENILDFSKIEEDIKNYRFEEHHLDQIIQDLIPVFRGRIGNDSWEINLDIQGAPPSMLLDRDAIQQVLFNLLDNAYKYSNGSQRIDLGLYERGTKNEELNRNDDQRKMTEIVIEVRDYGIGIGEKDLERVFERFYRGDRLRTEGIKGSGIGLTIVNRIVKAHGGRIEVESQIDKGTTFYVYLPVNQNGS